MSNDDDAFMAGLVVSACLMVIGTFVIWGALQWRLAELTVLAVVGFIIYHWRTNPRKKAARAREKRVDDRVCELMARGYNETDAAQMAEAELQKEAKASTDEMKKAGVER